MEFNWGVAQLERQASDNFVTIVHYRVTAVDGDYTASTYGTCSYTQDSETFIPFESLTPEIVTGWVKKSLGEDTVEAALASQIEAQKAPAQIAGLPW